MKKLILIALIAVCWSFSVNAQTTKVKLSTEKVGTRTLNAQTMHVAWTDKVVKLSVYVPSFATDSLLIEGRKFTIDGIETNAIKIPPGEATVNLGFDYAYLDSVTLTSADISWIFLLIEDN